MKMTSKKRDELLSVLYEKCSNGEISRYQREKLIEKINSMFVVTESAIQTTDNSSDDLLNKKRYDIFKESVYNKYTNGEITIETREELLKRAREKFLLVSE